MNEGSSLSSDQTKNILDSYHALGGTVQAKEQIKMKMINFNINIMNMKSGRSGVGSDKCVRLFF